MNTLFLILKNYRVWLAVSLLAVAYGFGHHSGSLKTHAYYQNILLKQAQENETKLQTALIKQQEYLAKAEIISQKQAAFNMQNERQAFELKKEIKNVIAKDKATGSDCTGLGKHGLQHYRKSLGY